MYPHFSCCKKTMLTVLRSCFNKDCSEMVSVIEREEKKLRGNANGHAAEPFRTGLPCR